MEGESGLSQEEVFEELYRKWMPTMRRSAGGADPGSIQKTVEQGQGPDGGVDGTEQDARGCLSRSSTASRPPAGGCAPRTAPRSGWRRRRR